jgi:hypothetical protein
MCDGDKVIFYGESILEIFASFALDKYVCMHCS